MSRRTSRRTFVKTLAAAGAGLSLPLGSRARAAGPNGRLRIASIGCGGKGWSDLVATAASPHVDVVALCNIDEGPDHMGRAAEKYPKAARYADWRRLLDDAQEVDAVIVSTPDHMHAPISMAAMALGKHVQCQKPLTHTVYEARQMRLAAKRAGVVTQMGNQIQSHVAYRTAVRLVHDGAIGKVREVHSWQSGKMGWLLESDRPAGEDPVPPTVHWDNWLGVAPARPFKTNIYHPFNWRAWQDFSNGQLGDFGCHILDPVFMSLELTA
ncbi:MAG TPA: Gfo/Idh/MocA family oxidoreductase, partial [Pirellulales bacterium]|nr:Gfo/Idh/MocA family oxidoreductase [Pirellulales bacterium]